MILPVHPLFIGVTAVLSINNTFNFLYSTSRPIDTIGRFFVLRFLFSFSFIIFYYPTTLIVK
jgi:hypothetical protein